MDPILDIEIRPIFRLIALVGRAFTVSATPRDNGIYRQALRECRPGDVPTSRGRSSSRAHCR